MVLWSLLLISDVLLPHLADEGTTLKIQICVEREVKVFISRSIFTAPTAVSEGFYLAGAFLPSHSSDFLFGFYLSLSFFLPQGVLDRFSQIQPKLIFSVAAVVYNGKTHDHMEKLTSVVKGWPTINSLRTIKHYVGFFDCLVVKSDSTEISSIELHFLRTSFLGSKEPNCATCLWE